MWSLLVTILLILAGAVCITLLVWFIRSLIVGPPGDRLFEVARSALAFYCRTFHRVTFEGEELVPKGNDPGPLIVVSNHTAGIDPLLINTACKFPIRWMMAANFMNNDLAPFWKWRRLIPVARDGTDSGPAREAIRHVKAGGQVGIFPEGGLTRPRGELRPFQVGVGLIVARAKAPVLLCWVRDTPDTDRAFDSLKVRSHSKVTFLDMIDFGNERDPKVITQVLRKRIAEVSGWPINDEPLPSARQ